jgi:hypothetical protein
MMDELAKDSDRQRKDFERELASKSMDCDNLRRAVDE